MEIKDRVFIVTGASSGIGLSTAIVLSERGAKVALLARSTDALKELARKLPGSFPFTVDMTQFDRVREAVAAVHQQYGRIDGLVNNAGRSYAAAIEEIEPPLRSTPSLRRPIVPCPLRQHPRPTSSKSFLSSWSQTCPAPSASTWKVSASP